MAKQLGDLTPQEREDLIAKTRAEQAMYRAKYKAARHAKRDAKLIVEGKPVNGVQKLSDLLNFSPKQIQALETVKTHKYTLYGGAKGGGKSYWLRWMNVYLHLHWAARGHVGVRTVLFCEDYPSLKDRQISKIATEFPDWLGKLQDSQINGMSFQFSPRYGSGVIALRNLDDPAKYASSEFAAASIDELTKNPREVFDQIRSTMRWKGIDDCKFLGGSNPGGIGHSWVKQLWIDRDFPKVEVEADQFAFIRALAADNPSLSKNYLLQLEGLPEGLRKAYLEGSWDLFEGQFFSEWRDSVHIVDPFPIPDTWRRFRTVDHGRTAPTACYWGAVDHDGNIYIYREYYQAGVDADVNAEAIAKLSGDERYWFRVMDSACFSKTGTGETIAEIYERNGAASEPWPKNRHAGWALFHEYLRHGEVESFDPLTSQTVKEMKKPKLVFFSSCKNAIRTIPAQKFNDLDPEDLDSHGEDHSADAIRGALEYLHEGKTPALKTGEAAFLSKIRVKGRIGPENLKSFYGHRY